MFAPLKPSVPLLLFVSLGLTACVPPVKDETKHLSRTKDTITVGNITMTEEPAASGWTPGQLIDGPYSDPFVGGWYGLTSYPQAFLIQAVNGGTPGADFETVDNLILIAIFTGESQVSPAPATYPLGGSPDTGGAIVEYVDITGADTVCVAGSGTLTVNKGAKVGDALTGTILVDNWLAFGNPCPIPEPATGSFRVVREIDDQTGNDGSGTDTVTVSDIGLGFTKTYTESPTVLNDPVLQAYFSQEWDGIAEQFVDALRFTFGMDGDPVAGQYTRSYSATYYGVTGPGTYPKTGGDSANEQFSSGTNCSGANAPLNLTALGPVGGLITGDILSDASGIAPCPTQFDLNFSVTRERDRTIPVPAFTGDSFLIGGATITERNAQTTTVNAQVNLVSVLENVVIQASRRSPASATNNAATLVLTGPASMLQAPAAYSLANTGTPLDNIATLQTDTFVDNAPSVPCFASGGSATVTHYGGLGGTIEGTINVSSDTCGGTMGTGTFVASIDSVYSFGNDGAGTDSFTLAINAGAPATFTEVASPRNDPLAYGQARPASNDLTIVLKSDDNRAFPRWNNDIQLVITSPAPGPSAVGGNLAVTLFGQYGTCTAAAGSSTVTLSSYPAAGQLITGSYTIVDDGVSGTCGFGVGGNISGTFAVTREGDDLN